MTLLVSSHILAEIEQIADTVGVINHGRLIEEVSMEQVRETNTEYIEFSTNDCKKAVYVLSHHLNLNNIRVLNEQCVRIYDTSVPQKQITKTLIINDVEVDSIHQKNSTLEDYFLRLLNGGDLHA